MSYKLYTNAKQWNDAKTTCENDQAQLAVISSEVIVNYVKQRNIGNVWIGGTDKVKEGDLYSIRRE